MDGNIETASDRSRIHRSSQACQRCRTLKARCLPGPHDGTCQRCDRSSRECIWADARPRTRRHYGTSRIHQVEKKIDRLFAQISGGPEDAQLPDQTSADRADGDGFLSPPATLDQKAEVQNEDNESTLSLEEVTKLHDFDLSAENGQRTNQSKNTTADDQLATSLAAHPEAEELLNEYRSMSHSFPFVPITEDITFEAISKTKPMVLLSIMTVASWQDKRLQMRLEKQFRTELAHRTLISPSKDLVLLQSILVYVAWSHWYLDAKIRNPATVLHLAVAIVSDLRLVPKNQDSANICSRDSNDASSWREKYRAVLGCYFLCSAIRSEFSVSTLLDYRDYMHEWCKSLSEDPEFESDMAIKLLIESSRVQDMVHGNTMLSNDRLSLATNDQVLEQFYLWKTRFQDWARQSPREEHSRLMNILCYSLESKLHNTLASNISKSGQGSNDGALDNGHNLCSSLSAQLEAGKMFLDTLVEVPFDATYLVSFAEWISVPRIVMEMTRLSLHSPSHPQQWNVKEAQDRIRLNLYLDSLCFRMHNLTTYKPPTQPCPDYWTVMKAIMQAVNKWYTKKIRQGADNNRPASTTTFNAQSEARLGAGSVAALNENFADQGQLGDYGFATPDLFNDSNFDLFDSSNNAQGSYCPWLPLDLRMDLDNFNGDLDP